MKGMARELHINGQALLGLSTRDLGSGSDVNRGSGSKDHFASTQPRSGSELRVVLCDSAT